jgi:transcription elongation factor GreB
VSKAFTKEDDGSEAPRFFSRRAPLPVNSPNYVTPAGFRGLRSELERLLAAPPPEIAADTDVGRSQAAALQKARIAELEARIASAVLVDPAAQPQDEVRFGAEVTVRGTSGAERTYRVVGVDEADAQRGALAFVAPLARSLLGKRVGDSALVVTPNGEDELEILSIRYKAD